MGNIDVEKIKEKYQPGTKIMVLEMKDPLPVESDFTGVVDYVDDIGNVYCVFKNGRRIDVIPGVDRFVRYSV